MADLTLSAATSVHLAPRRSAIDAANTESSAPATVVAKKEEGLHIDMSALGTAKKEADAKAEEAESQEPAHIKLLRDRIKELQKQLDEAQKRLQEASQGPDDQAKATRVAAAQAAVATISGALLQATAQLLKALTETGTSSAGSSLNTTA
ncbi:hypothetical protein [Pseudomonas fontis]|uniref:Uncharacterized protein n=1 Tax=Pseudomonas fontis TaxID=2942633 RepID=A0ABT5NMG5_9PSED|nr:hypothetical protein [Pseudomonas fontis]MDD0976132.1 hypothetical protein [Pseudomonas fontis]MDD0989004.1 hypothetical protein [Pseudomonas fontis]